MDVTQKCLWTMVLEALFSPLSSFSAFPLSFNKWSDGNLLAQSTLFISRSLFGVAIFSLQCRVGREAIYEESTNENYLLLNMSDNLTRMILGDLWRWGNGNFKLGSHIQKEAELKFEPSIPCKPSVLSALPDGVIKQHFWWPLSCMRKANWKVFSTHVTAG